MSTKIADYDIYEDWNPWHGCTKISPGCKYCYVYRQDERYNSKIVSSECKKNKTFDYPIQRKRDGSYKLPSGKVVFTCFTSDFLLEDADEWRPDCFKMMKERSDCYFYFFTKRIDRLEQCLPEDWGDGYENVLVGCTIENQDRADYRLPIFNSLPIKHKSVIIAPMIEKIDISKYLNDDIEEVSVGGESGQKARVLDFDWVLSIRDQCKEKNIPFRFHQTGAHFRKDGKEYYIKRRYQKIQAQKADIDLMIGEYLIPETAQFDSLDEKDDLQLKIEL